MKIEQVEVQEGTKKKIFSLALIIGSPILMAPIAVVIHIAPSLGFGGTYPRWDFMDIAAAISIVGSAMGGSFWTRGTIERVYATAIAAVFGLIAFAILIEYGTWAARYVMHQ